GGTPTGPVRQSVGACRPLGPGAQLRPSDVRAAPPAALSGLAGCGAAGTVDLIAPCAPLQAGLIPAVRRPATLRQERAPLLPRPIRQAAPRPRRVRRARQPPPAPPAPRLTDSRPP